MKYHIEFDLALRENPYPGLYLAVEGIDGSGKSTQIELLQKYFEGKGKTVLITYEPSYENVAGQLVREVLEGKVQLPSVMLQYLYSASRVYECEKTIYPALEKGTVVITHRSFWSAVPYGILDVMEENYDFTKAKVIMAAHGILSHYYQFIAPDKAIYLRTPVDVALERLTSRNKHVELYEKKSKMEKVIKGYEWLVTEFADAFIAVDSVQPIEKIHKEITQKLEVRS